MTIILALIFCVLLSLLLINNLAPDFSSKYRRLYTWPIFLFTILTYSLLISQILSGNPHFNIKATCDWLPLGSTNLDMTFFINNPVLIFGTMLATMFLIQIINLYTRQDSKSQPESQNNLAGHQINCIYTLIIAGLLILMADSLLVLFCGMALISGVVIYRNLLINGGIASLNSLIWFLIADSIYLIAVLYTYTVFHTLSISEIASIVNSNIQSVQFSSVGFLITLSIIIKLIRIPFSEQNDHTGSFVDQSIFNIGAISIIMILPVRFMNILCSPCLTFMLIIGIIIALFSAVSSLFKNSSEPAYKSLLLAQTGIFLIIIGGQTSINTLLFIVSFTFANLLLIISQDTIQQSQLAANSGSSIFKTGRVWIFLFAAFGISGLLPGSGFIPRNVLIQHYLSIASDNPLFWVVLVFISLGLLLISFASFRYFFNNLYRWKTHNTSGSTPHLYGGVLFGILILLNLYPVFSLPHFNPIFSNSWICRIMPNHKVLSDAVNSQLYTASGVTIGIPLIGFFFALLIYRFQLIQTSSIHSVFKPLKQLYSLPNTMFANFIKFISGIFASLSSAFITIEETAIQKIIVTVSVFLNSLASGFVSLNRKFTSRKPSMNVLNRISNNILITWEKQDLLIPLLLVIIMIIILVLSII